MVNEISNTLLHFNIPTEIILMFLDNINLFISSFDPKLRR